MSGDLWNAGGDSSTGSARGEKCAVDKASAGGVGVGQTARTPLLSGCMVGNGG